MWRRLESSNLKRVRYFRRNRLLLVEFRSRDIWAYLVDWSTYLQLLRADSHGKFFNRHIRLQVHRMEVPQDMRGLLFK